MRVIAVVPRGEARRGRRRNPVKHPDSRTVSALQHARASSAWGLPPHRRTAIGSLPRGGPGERPGKTMISLRKAADDFLAQRRIAVAGVSRNPEGGHSANGIYRRLRERGYEVFAVNPNAGEVEGDPCYHSLAEIPGGVDAVVVSTTPTVAEDVVRDCVDLGISRVWLHRSLGAGSVSDAAIEVGHQHGIPVIAGGCPLMFAPATDPVHRMMRAVLSLTGAVPRKVQQPGE